VQKAVKRITYINPETGEFSQRDVKIDLQFDEDEGYLFWKNKSYVKSFLDMPLPSELSWADKGKIEHLRHFILRDNQLLVYRSNNVAKPITHVEMIKMFDLSEKHTKILIKKCKEQGILKEVEISGVAYFAYNPIYALKSKRINLTIYLIFQDELRKVLPPWVIVRFMDQVKELKPNLKIIE
jgi:hypothetical protein